MKIRILQLAVLCALLVPALPARASDLINVFDDWSAFAIKQGGAKVCYIGSEPVKSEGKYKKRGSVLFLVTHRPANKIIGEVNFMAGYTFKGGSEARITIGGDGFDLFTKGSDAWARDGKTDKAIVKAMIRGSKMVVRAVSSRGTKTTDTFSLKGFTAAYKAASKACKV